MTEQTDTPKPSTGVTPGLFQMYGERTAGKSAAFLLPHLAPGMELVDCGCGLGSITVGLAEAVAPGRVVGIDSNAEAIESARRRAAERGLTNVRFEVGSIYELAFEDASFNAAFSHMVFMHLEDREAAAKEVHRILKPGGLFGVRDRAKDGDRFGNRNPDFDLLWDLFLKWQAHRGSDLGLGPRLPSILAKAGFKRIEASSSFSTEEDFENRLQQLKMFFGNPAITDTMIAQRWTDRETIARLPEAVDAWARHPDAAMDLASTDAIGWKE